MPRILSVGTSLPDYEINQGKAKSFAKLLFKDTFKDIERLLTVFENTEIKQRHFCVPIEWFDKEHSFEDKNNIYIKNAIKLSKEAIFNAIAKVNIEHKDINHIYFISSTGISTPSIDAYLFNEPEINFNNNIKRTPIWGLGCAGGAAGISRAFEYTTANPSEIALVIAVEIGELAFLRKDLSKSNLIATSLFADGAAAVIIAGDNVHINNKENNIRIIDTHSTIWNDSLNVMGWDLKNDGLKVIFSKDIPSIIRNQLKPSLEYFLNKKNISISELKFFVLHPGGTKVIEAYEDVFNIDNNKLKLTKEVLSNYGNMSSPTVLFVLEKFLNIKEKGYGILLALGPGFSSEMILLNWE